MRALVATGLALLAAVHGDVVYADPSTPQISPRQGQREDSQRLREQLRGLDRETQPEPVAAPSPPSTAADPARGHELIVSTAADDKPLLQRWWFWTVIGAVAVTAIGVAYGATQSSQPHLSGVTCDAAGCHL